jgi:hypothetical protein
MVPVLERVNSFLQKKTEERHILAKSRRSAEAEERLQELSKDLDVNERITFSTAYRFSKQVATTFDYDLMDALPQIVESKLKYLVGGLAKEKQELTPEIVWTWIPELDPNKNTRTQIEFPSEQQEVVVIDFSRTEKAHLIPEAA